MLSNLAHSMVVRQEVEEAEENGGRLLHAQEAVEGPFAMELEDRFDVRRFAREAPVGHDMLAGIVALCWTGPEQETVFKRCTLMLGLINVVCSKVGLLTNVQATRSTIHL